MMQACGVLMRRTCTMRARRRCLGWLEAVWSTTRSRASMHRSLRTGRPAPARPSPWWGTTASLESSHDCARASLSGILLQSSSYWIILISAFVSIAANKNPDLKYKLTASYYEIYKEKVPTCRSIHCTQITMRSLLLFLILGQRSSHFQYKKYIVESSRKPSNRALCWGVCLSNETIYALIITYSP